MARAPPHYQTLLLAPPLGRALAALPALVSEALAALVPPLRSHFIYMVQKELVRCVGWSPDSTPCRRCGDWALESGTLHADTALP
jgi:hypothetical protein